MYAILIGNSLLAHIAEPFVFTDETIFINHRTIRPQVMDILTSLMGRTVVSLSYLPTTASTATLTLKRKYGKKYLAVSTFQITIVKCEPINIDFREIEATMRNTAYNMGDRPVYNDCTIEELPTQA